MTPEEESRGQAQRQMLATSEWQAFDGGDGRESHLQRDEVMIHVIETEVRVLWSR